MGWSEEVHASRMASAPRKRQSSHLPLPQPRKPNAGIFPIAVVAAAGTGALLMRKNGVKLPVGCDPLARLVGFLQRLLGGGGRKVSDGKRKGGSTKWKQARPQEMAAAAAATRAQSSTQASTSGPGGQGGGKKKNKKKKKRGH